MRRRFGGGYLKKGVARLPVYLPTARLAHMMTASAAIWPSTVAVALNLPMSRLWVMTSR